MPTCFIEGPSGLTTDAKKELIEKVLKSLVEAYQMTDDRVYINEYPVTNVGDTGQTEEGPWSIQSEPAKPVGFIDAPPGLPINSRRKMMHDITMALAGAYNISDLRDILIFLHEFPIENVANNGFLQTENPEFESPATELNHKA